MLEGHDPWEISARIRGDARLFTFIVRDEDAGRVDELKLPRDARVVCLYRENQLRVPDDETRLEAGDEVVLVTASGNLERLGERWGTPPRQT
jgi:trk system potassium uptake protein TrkA